MSDFEDPDDSTVLRDLAHMIEHNGVPYGWVPNRLREIAKRMEELIAADAAAGGL